jgi:hypothetical protein
MIVEMLASLYTYCTRMCSYKTLREISYKPHPIADTDYHA